MIANKKFDIKDKFINNNIKKIDIKLTLQQP